MVTCTTSSKRLDGYRACSRTVISPAERHRQGNRAGVVSVRSQYDDRCGRSMWTRRPPPRPQRPTHVLRRHKKDPQGYQYIGRHLTNTRLTEVVSDATQPDLDYEVRGGDKKQGVSDARTESRPDDAENTQERLCAVSGHLWRAVHSQRRTEFVW